MRLASSPSQRLDPAAHQRLAFGDVGAAQPFLEVDPVHRVHGAVEVLLVAERHRGVDTHAAFERGVGGGPFLVAGGHALGRLEGLPYATGQRVEDVHPRIHACGQRPHDVIHAVDVDIHVDGDGQAHALAAGQDAGQEVALPAVLDLVALLDLDNGPAPVGHAVGDIHVLDDAGLQPVAQLIDGRFADGGVDIGVVGHVDAEG